MVVERVLLLECPQLFKNFAILRTSFRCQTTDSVSAGDVVVERSCRSCVHRLHSGTGSYQAKLVVSKSTVFCADTHAAAGAASGDAAASAAAPSALCIEYVVIVGGTARPHRST